MTVLRRKALSIALLGTLAACGGSSNPLGNPPEVSNPLNSQGNQHLSFAYFQKCIDPIFLAKLQIPGSSTVNTCAGGGCHDTVTGTGGALRLISSAQPLDLSDPANTPDVIRASDMYKNFYSAQGMVIVGNPLESRLIVKPLVLNVFHGGGQVFPNQSDPNVQLIKYWITHPAPLGQDEFSTATYDMFTPADPKTGTCNTQ
jgi:hypothetical protein